VTRRRTSIGKSSHRGCFGADSNKLGCASSWATLSFGIDIPSIGNGGSLPQLGWRHNRRENDFVAELSQFKQGLQVCRRFGSEDHEGTMRSIKHPCRHLETNPVLLPRQPTPTKIPAEFVEDSVNMNSSTEEWMPGIVHFADFVFGGIVLRTSITKRETTKGSTTG
jgi:hypothetical protein